MYTVYVLKSLKYSRYYIGHTSNLANRLDRHNKGFVRSTKGYLPWLCIYKETLPNKKVAYRREMEIKSYKSGLKFDELIKKT